MWLLVLVFVNLAHLHRKGSILHIYICILPNLKRCEHPAKQELHKTTLDLFPPLSFQYKAAQSCQVGKHKCAVCSLLMRHCRISQQKSLSSHLKWPTCKVILKRSLQMECVVAMWIIIFGSGQWRMILWKFLFDFNSCNPQQTIHKCVPSSRNISLCTKLYFFLFVLCKSILNTFSHIFHKAHFSILYSCVLIVYFHIK